MPLGELGNGCLRWHPGGMTEGRRETGTGPKFKFESCWEERMGLYLGCKL